MRCNIRELAKAAYTWYRGHWRHLFPCLTSYKDENGIRKWHPW